MKHNSIQLIRKNLLEARYFKDKNQSEEDFFINIVNFVTKGLEKFNYEEEQLKTYREKLLQYLLDGDIIYNSPLLMNAGKSHALAGACFVLPVDDDLTEGKESIMNLQSLSAKIFKLGAGVGVDYSRLRPENTLVGSGGTASGPVSFMHLIDTLAEVVKSGGKRRAAIMSTLSVHHPDIKKFINIKNDNKTLSNTNISVKVTDDFMSHLNEGDTIEALNEWGGSQKILNSKELWDNIIENAWKTGDPGLVFIDTINRNTNGVNDMTYSAVNACSEFPLYPYESCLIGTINLSNCVDEETNNFNLFKIKLLTRILVTTLDNVIDIAWYPEKRIKDTTQKYRRIGIGVTGLGDALIKLGIPYDSIEARDTVSKILKQITTTAIKASQELAEILGPFSEWEKFIPSKENNFDIDNTIPRRNLAVTVIAPTGSTSILCGAECSGIEPMYSVAYKRMMRLADGENTWFNIVSPLFLKKLKEFHPDLTDNDIDKIVDKIIENDGSIQSIPKLSNNLKKLFKTAHEIKPEDHLEMIATTQKYIENSISKTINLPNSATKEDVEKIYIEAWKKGCKGITIYRDGCKAEQVYASQDKNLISHKKEERPDVLQGQTIKMSLPQGSLYVNVTFREHKPFEVFAILGKSGLDNHAYCEALGRLISLALRSGIDPQMISKSIKGIRGRDWGLWGDEYVWSVPHALGLALEYATQNNGNFLTKPPLEMSEKCPECGGKMVSDNGCMSCLACGYSKCSA